MTKSSLRMMNDRTDNIHETVLLKETVDALDVARDGVYIDATLGLGGHTEEILLRADKSSVVAIDQDPAALELATERLSRFGSRITFVKANFTDLPAVLKSLKADKVNGIVADLGISSLQLDTASRGFSFRFDAPLDMRMDPSPGVQTAAELLEELSEEEIANIIYRFGEERFSRRIARRIVERRDRGEPVTTTKQLAELVERSVKRNPRDKIHPATKTFQALRIAVNRELEILEQFLIDGIGNLKTNGRFAVITFHSLEDRIVKQTFQRLSGKCFCPPRIPQCVCGAEKLIELVNRKPIVPADDEIEKNPRSRSAKLRVVRRIADQSTTPGNPTV